MTTSNVLTGLMPSFFRALNMVNNEKTDAIDAVTLNADLAQAVVGQTITYPIAPAKTPYAISSQATPIDINGDTAGYATGSISASEATGFKYTGEEQKQLQLGGISQYYADQAAQCIRALRNLIEKTIVDAAATAACRAVGTVGTRPFTWNLSTTSGMENIADLMQAVEENGTPTADLRLILGVSSASSLRKVPNLFRANEAGTDRLLRTGDIGLVEGFNVGVSPQIKTWHTNGTQASGTLGAAATAGPYTTAQTLTVTSSTGVLAGDILYFASDPRKYVIASVPAGGVTLTIAAPGLFVSQINGAAYTIDQGNVNTSIATQYLPNIGFSRDAIHLIARQPMLPVQVGGTATGVTGAVGTMLECKLLPDPRSKLVYQVVAWGEHRQITIEFGLAYGVMIPNPQNLFILEG